jgi:hypothetical protein
LIGSAVIVELLFPFRRYDRDVLHVELIMVLQVAMNARVLRIRSKLEPRKQDNKQRNLQFVDKFYFYPKKNCVTDSKEGWKGRPETQEESKSG